MTLGSARLAASGGFKPLPESGEHVCDCYDTGEHGVWAHTGERHVHERVVRCKDCRMFDGVGCDLLDFAMPSMGNGFCAWGVGKGE